MQIRALSNHSPDGRIILRDIHISIDYK